MTRNDETEGGQLDMAYRLPAIRDAQKSAVLKHLSELGMPGRACAAAGVPVSTVLEWRRADEEFAAAWETAARAAAAKLEDEMIRRGRDGWTETGYQGGRQVGEIQRYSDTLLIFALKGAMPEKYPFAGNTTIVNLDQRKQSITIEYVDARGQLAAPSSEQEQAAVVAQDMGSETASEA